MINQEDFAVKKKKFLSGTSVDSEKITSVVSEKRSTFPGLCIPDDIEQENEVCLFTLREDDDLDKLCKILVFHLRVSNLLIIAFMSRKEVKKG